MIEASQKDASREGVLGLVSSQKRHREQMSMSENDEGCRGHREGYGCGAYPTPYSFTTIDTNIDTIPPPLNPPNEMVWSLLLSWPST
jgi:hypothetical protein